ncbi:MAG TPA: DUF5615 family PIN-like protein [Lacipirellulaceae bacterium]|nr:DUF5615 family PIN-like protein [Lacipirellulaceae bacterium]
MARLYANENFPLPVVVHLRDAGHDVLTTADVGRSGQAIGDAAVLAFALTEDRILLTLNRRHFFRLHREATPHAGIVACTFDVDFSGQAARIDAALRAAGEMHGRLVRVNRPSDE